MGYKRKIYKFRFEDNPDLEGLEVVTRPVPLEDLVGMADDLDLLQAGKASRAVIEKMADLLAGCMISWTVEEDDGTPAPLPASGKEFLAEDAQLAMAIIEAWSERIIKVAPPLPTPSGPGPSAGPEASLPMEALSQNHQSSPVPA